MNNIRVTTKRLSKSFTMLDRKTMFLRVLKSFIKNESSKETRWVLRDLSCIIKTNERLALLGRNGSGKTTFLRILTGIYDPTEGTFNINGTSKILFNSSVGLNAHISVIDNIFLLGAIHGLERNFLKKESPHILKTAGLEGFENALLKKLSTGQIQRLALSIFFKSQGDLLIFDEALANVDHQFINIFDNHFKELSKSNTTIIMTSHDSAFLKKYCTTALWLDNGTVKMHGPFDEVNAAYEKSILI